MSHLEELRADKKLVKKLDPTAQFWQEESLDYMYRRKKDSVPREVTAWNQNGSFHSATSVLNYVILLLNWIDFFFEKISCTILKQLTVENVILQLTGYFLHTECDSRIFSLDSFSTPHALHQCTMLWRNHYIATFDFMTIRYASPYESTIAYQGLIFIYRCSHWKKMASL